MRQFETFLNRRYGRKNLKVNVLLIPTTRDHILEQLREGHGDIAAANLTVTPERLKLVDFTIPIATDIDELLVTGKTAPAVSRLRDLAGRRLLVRPASSYFEHLQQVNDILRRKGLAPIHLEPASTYLQDYDMLKMVSAGVLPWAVVDSHKAEFWARALPDLEVRHDIVVHSQGNIAWAVRKNSPQLKRVLDAFVKKNRKGTLVGNVLINRYFKKNRWLKNPVDSAALKRFDRVMGLFQKYGGEYDFDWIMLVALAYQESGLDNRKHSNRGAVGIMQMLPSTARDPNVNVADIHDIENNIKAGTRYLRFLHDRYFASLRSDEINRMLFTIAAYNAGPKRILKARKKAASMRLDPGLWFGNVEVAAASMLGRETVAYVSNVYKYYTAYRLVVDSSRHKREVDAIRWSLGKR